MLLQCFCAPAPPSLFGRLLLQSGTAGTKNIPRASRWCSSGMRVFSNPKPLLPRQPPPFFFVTAQCIILLLCMSKLLLYVACFTNV